MTMPRLQSAFFLWLLWDSLSLARRWFLALHRDLFSMKASLACAWSQPVSRAIEPATRRGRGDAARQCDSCAVLDDLEAPMRLALLLHLHV